MRSPIEKITLILFLILFLSGCQITEEQKTEISCEEVYSVFPECKAEEPEPCEPIIKTEIKIEKEPCNTTDLIKQVQNNTPDYWILRRQLKGCEKRINETIDQVICKEDLEECKDDLEEIKGVLE